ncbi:MAG: MarR family winged helix-turn-helix transcriptional regulator [Bacillota bacterium]
MPRAPNEIGDLWWAINRRLHDRFREAFRGSELPPMALVFLRHIDHSPGVTIGELARRSGTVKSHVSKMVEHLVRQGYLEKRADPADQRLVRVYASKLAAETKSAMEARAREAWLGVTGEIPEGQLESVVGSLRTLLEALERSNAKDGLGRS